MDLPVDRAEPHTGYSRSLAAQMLKIMLAESLSRDEVERLVRATWAVDQLFWQYLPLDHGPLAWADTVEFVRSEYHYQVPLEHKA